MGLTESGQSSPAAQKIVCDELIYSVIEFRKKIVCVCVCLCAYVHVCVCASHVVYCFAEGLWVVKLESN